MSDEKEVGSASTIEGPTAAQIKEQIDARQRELKREAAVKPVAPSPEPAPAPAPVTPEPVTDQPLPNKPPEAAPESGAAAVPGPTGNDKPMQEWMKKKGFKSVEDMARSLRELERELSRSRNGPGPLAQPPAPPEPPVSRPPYQPPAPNIEELAKRYNMDPSDLERVAPLAADIAANHVAREMAPLRAELNSLRRDHARSAELQSLKEDPTFADPRVQFEMHQILESNPSILQNEPAPLRFAFNEAMRSIGRRILEGSFTPETVIPPVSGSSGLPTAPPRTAGGSGSGSAAPSGLTPPAKLTQEAFNRLPAAEQRKVLEQMGRIAQEF